uniref:ADAM metallopeptidase domain 33 n=1 Tax=Suricata suricatta TaxID=37032 RepID=A0A673TJZ7_SURSU
MGPGFLRARGSWASLLLLLLLLLWLPLEVSRAEAFQGNSPGEPVTLHWVLDGQPRRTATLQEPVWKLDMGLVALEAEGQELLLELEKNHRLLAPGYTETHYTPDGQPVVLVPDHTDHCHYHGRVRGFPDSWVVLSTCSGMRGLITLGSNASFYVHPASAGDSEDFITHRMFRTSQLLSWKGACGHREAGNKGDVASLSRATQIKERREVRRSPRFLELYIVADHTLFLTQHQNLNRTKERLLEVANYVAQILRTLDIQVALTGLEVWTERDQSRRQVRAFFRKGGGACLSNAPDAGALVPQARCGNGLVEDGEECDCGPSQECADACCLAHNCSLRAGAQCAHGDCCARCLLKPAGVLCRRAAGDCDLPEFCTGDSPYCPLDIFLLDGSPCASGRGYCRDGACPTLEQQCQQLWGPGSSPAPEACFHIVNSAGDAHGNCGQDGKGGYVPCLQRDVQCGKLQCLGGEQRPLAPHTVPVDSTIGLGSSEVTCRGVFLLPGVQLDLHDLGLVEPGTQCGPRMVCQDKRCQNTTFRELERCLTSCHGHGVCNSNYNCHCAPGWAPPYCDKPGFGGSVDSGPIQPENHKAFLLAVILSFLLPLLPGAGLAWCCCRQPGSRLQQCLWGSRRDLACSGPKDGPQGDCPPRSVHGMESGPAATEEPGPRDLKNSPEPKSHLERLLPVALPATQGQVQKPRFCLSR